MKGKANQSIDVGYMFDVLDSIRAVLPGYEGCTLGGSRALQLDDDHGFRSLGTSPASIGGYWDLPSMVSSHSIAIDSDTFRRFGGFPEWIRGWGGEDVALGFKAAASHVPIVPLLTVSRQAAHDPHSGSQAAKLDELRRNILEYRRWAGSADVMPSWPESEYFEARIV